MSGRLKMEGTRGTRRTLYLSVASAIGPATRTLTDSQLNGNH